MQMQVDSAKLALQDVFHAQLLELQVVINAKQLEQLLIT